MSSQAESCFFPSGGGCCGRNLGVLSLVYSAFVICADSLRVPFAGSVEGFGFRFPCQSVLCSPQTVLLSQLYGPFLGAWMILESGSELLSCISFPLFCHLHVMSSRFLLLEHFSLPAVSVWCALHFHCSSHTAFQPLCLWCLRSVLGALSPTYQL